jgi:transcription-repair coupling factor (superfamily II helicase)
VPKETQDLIKISRIRSMAEHMCITRIHEKAGKIIFDFAGSNTLNAKILSGLSAKYGLRVFIHGGAKPFIRLAYDKAIGKIDETISFLEILKGA